MLNMWRGPASATALCFIGFLDSADIERVTYESLKNNGIIGGLFEITASQKQKTNWKLVARGLENILCELFLRPGKHTNH